MKKLLRLAVLIMCITWLLALFGCGKEKPHMLDGPGMEYTPEWTEFTLSRSDSYAQHNFSFTVTEGDTEPMVSGVCRDEDGNEYDVETGIVLTGETLWTLRRLNLEQLPEEEPWPEDLELPLDAATITLTLTMADGNVVKKNASSNLSIEIYNLLLPYFINNQS